MKLTPKYLILFILLLTINPIHAQDKDDMCLWINADITIKKNKWAYIGNLEYRMEDNISKPKLYSVGLFARYAFSKHFRANFGYEFFANDDGYQNINIDHRMLLQGEALFNIQNFQFVNRLSLLDTFEKMGTPKWGWRDRLKISYPVGKFAPYTSIEVYCKHRDSKLQHSKNRYAVGATYTYKMNHTLDIYYMAEDFSKRDLTKHIIGVTYSYGLTFL